MNRMDKIVIISIFAFCVFTAFQLGLRSAEVKCDHPEVEPHQVQVHTLVPSRKPDSKVR